jgi:hypothetical protein
MTHEEIAKSVPGRERRRAVEDSTLSPSAKEKSIWAFLGLYAAL